MTTPHPRMLSTGIKVDPKRLAIGSVAALLLIYTVVRAITVSFSWDEAYTFTHHVSKGLFFQDTFDYMGANHHPLNVWLMWCCMKLLGDGACTDQPASGKQCLRFNASSRAPERLQWTVPEGWDGSDVLVTGSALVRQANETNWVTLWIAVDRDGKTVEKRDVASYSQMVRYE